VPHLPQFPPRYISDESGAVVGVILSVEDYRAYLRALAAQSDWESLPDYLQDAIDNLLADEAEAEGGELRPLRDVLAEGEPRR
jgi:hypothetical protein